MREFKDAMSGVQRDIEDSIKPEDKKPIDKKNN
jgi:Sec-independent protein translocase protein TatA